jgi:hypothetical protein
MVASQAFASVAARVVANRQAPARAVTMLNRISSELVRAPNRSSQCSHGDTRWRSVWTAAIIEARIALIRS